MESIEELVAKLNQLCEPGARDRLISKGLSRGMIWENGVLATDSPKFSSDLTNDLLNHGYLVLGCSLRLRILEPTHPILDDSFRTAAEAIEAAIRRGEQSADRGFHLTVSAAAFHLGHFAARSYSLLAEEKSQLNLSSVEVLLVALMQRQLKEVQSMCVNWLNDDSHTDNGISALLESTDIDFDGSDAAYIAICQLFHRAIANFEFALRTGESQYVDQAKLLLDTCIEASEQLKHVPLWWISILARHLIDDLWGRSLYQLLPVDPSGNDRWSELRQSFIELLCSRDISEVDLWPSQIIAARRVIDEKDNLVVALPTSSGKTRVAELCILKCLAGGRRVVYVTPLRALSAQVEVTLGRTFKPLGFTVSSVYGASGVGASDVDTMQSADIVVATPEKLDFAIRQDFNAINDVGLIVLDEGHMIGLSEREIRYEVLVQRLLRRTDAATRRIVCLSAIFTEGESFDSFTQWIRLDSKGDAIRSQWRPTRQRPATIEWQSTGGRLEYRVEGETVFVPRFIDQVPPRGRRRNSFPSDRSELIVASVDRFSKDGHSVLIYCPMRKSVETVAESFLKLHQQGYVGSFISDNDKSHIELALRIGGEWLGINHVAMKALRLGIAVHHGHLPRPFLTEIERLLRKRVLNTAIASPTLAQGVDLSFSVLVFSSLWRSGKVLVPKEFANVIGRVGRAFVDLDGIYVLPVHESDARKRTKRVSEFHTLVTAAGKRELESGIYLLIYVCLWRLKQKLEIQGDELIQYVLNQQVAIDQMTIGTDENAEQMLVILAELDAGILALVEDLECDASEIATKLDDALKSSLWQRRLAVRAVEEQTAQIALLHGRARHIWGRTSNEQRKGFFAASIGTDSGLQIIEQRDDLKKFLVSATEAINTNQTTKLVSACSGLAERLFIIHPFVPDSMPSGWDVENWQPIIEAWLSGYTLYRTTDSVGIAFVQEAIVFRLVWAIEAVRVILESLEGDESPDSNTNNDETYVALCLTYGVPSVAAARMLEAGLESRLLAVRLAQELGLTFTTRDELNVWLAENRDSEPLVFSETEREAWNGFKSKQDSSFNSWERKKESYAFQPIASGSLNSGDRVRAVADSGGGASIYSVDCRLQGKLVSTLSENSTCVGTMVDSSEIQLEFFRPSEVPEWLKPYLVTL